MKKVILIFLGLLLVSLPISAQNGGSFCAQQPSQDSQTTNGQSSDEDDDFNPVTDEYYGSDQSLDFENREDINQNESNYDYEGAGGSS